MEPLPPPRADRVGEVVQDYPGQPRQPPAATVPGEILQVERRATDVAPAPSERLEVARRAPAPSERLQVERRVTTLAAEQGGVVSRAQLLALGLTRGAVEHRLATGRYAAVHRGVYAFAGAPLNARGRALAALLAGGEGAVLSHRSAAAHWALRPEPAVPEITVAGRHRASRPDLVVHRAAVFASAAAAAAICHRAGLTVTEPARTLLDLAAVEPPAALARAIAEAHVRRLTSRRDLRAAAANAPGHHGTAALLNALDAPRAAPTRSRLERTMLELVRRAGLPRPRVNSLICGHEADFAWPEHRVVVETDAWATHGDRLAFERDRYRDAELQAHGWTVVRFTWTQIREQPLRVAAQLAALLSRDRPIIVSDSAPWAESETIGRTSMW